MSKTFRSAIVLLALVFAGMSLYPSFWWYFLTSPEQKAFISLPANSLRDSIRSSAQQDLQLLLDSVREGAVDLKAEIAYLEPLAKKYQRSKRLEKPADWSPKSIAALFPTRQEFQSVIEDYQLEKALKQRARKDAALRLGLDLNGGYEVAVVPNADELDRKVKDLQAEEGESRSTQQLRSSLLGRTVDALGQRIDRFGLTEPELRVFRGGEMLQIAIPGQGGETGGAAVNGFLQAKGSLSFNLMDQDATKELADYLRANFDAEGKIDDQGQLAGYTLPDGYYIAPFYTKDKFGLDLRQGYVVVERSPLLKGENITEARADRDPKTARWHVVYSLDASGSADLRKIFDEYPGKYMAIIQDGRVISYPRISDRTDSTQVSNGGVIEGNFDQEEATTLAKVLNSGSLPVSLEVVSQQSVGALLGQDTVRSGLLAILFGFALVVVFMLAYYRSAGVNACLALFLNLFFLLALLAMMNTTLTMTSIVSIVLTVGMSVDANVIIFERIKEELRQGKSRAAAIKLGFSRAFWTIMDANITTGIAAVFLSALGEGAIKGFAITLAWGITCSLFSAIFVSHLLFDVISDLGKKNQLKISWRKLVV